MYYSEEASLGEIYYLFYLMFMQKHVILPNRELCHFSLGYMVPPKNLWLLTDLLLPTGTQCHNTEPTTMPSNASVLCMWFINMSPPSSQSPAQLTWHTVLLWGPSSSSCIAPFSVSLFLTSWNEYFPCVVLLHLKPSCFLTSFTPESRWSVGWIISILNA